MIAPPAYEIEPEALRAFLDRKVAEYNRPSFIPEDPVSIPHAYSLRQDIEIAGFFAAIFSWGNRTTIIRKSAELMQLMDRSPHQFILHHTDKELKKLLAFKHRTFNTTDLLYFIEFLRHHYTRYDSLEDAFLLGSPIYDHGGVSQASHGTSPTSRTGLPLLVSAAPSRFLSLAAFHHYFFSLEAVPPRTRKHIATPERNSSCKRLNMFLRWMVRKDDKGVDFGLWDRILPGQLICPLDLHVARVAKRFGLLTRKPTDWPAALELTRNLALLDPEDPVKYDFALFGLGVMEKF
jgi:uncharacterized protein (TIGR02757 family)